MMISNPIETTTKPAAGLAAVLRTLEEKGLIRRQTDPQTGRSMWVAAVAFTVMSDGSVPPVATTAQPGKFNSQGELRIG